MEMIDNLHLKARLSFVRSNTPFYIKPCQGVHSNGNVWYSWVTSETGTWWWYLTFPGLISTQKTAFIRCVIRATCGFAGCWCPVCLAIVKVITTPTDSLFECCFYAGYQVTNRHYQIRLRHAAACLRVAYLENNSGYAIEERHISRQIRDLSFQFSLLALSPIGDWPLHENQTEPQLVHCFSAQKKRQMRPNGNTMIDQRTPQHVK